MGVFKDKVGVYDVRKLLNLRRLLVKENNPQVVPKVEKILLDPENEAGSKILFEYIRDKDGVNLERLTSLIKAFDQTRYRFHQHGSKHTQRERPFGTSKFTARAPNNGAVMKYLGDMDHMVSELLPALLLVGVRDPFSYS